MWTTAAAEYDVGIAKSAVTGAIALVPVAVAVMLVDRLPDAVVPEAAPSKTACVKA